ncbi:hypothetical protein [Rhodococcus sp. NPDC060176]|uniref:hypothetical protein n=1 Tax=Rhodococcus sp. NPDC060176 TaxID=3347062 RepID=UPI003646A8FF
MENLLPSVVVEFTDYFPVGGQLRQETPMPQRDSIVVLTSTEVEIVNAATNAEQSKAAIKLLTQQINDNNATIKVLRNGPKSADEFAAANRAARANLALVQVLPQSQARDELVAELERALVFITEGLEMHDVQADG